MSGFVVVDMGCVSSKGHNDPGRSPLSSGSPTGAGVGPGASGSATEEAAAAAGDGGGHGSHAAGGATIARANGD